MNLTTIIEILSVALSLTFLFLLIKEDIRCWMFGIMSSLLSIYLFIDAQLYSEAILYCFYVFIGFYGWQTWLNGKGEEDLPIIKWSRKSHIYLLLSGISLSLLLGLFFSTKTDAAQPFVDSHTTIFSFIASYLEVHKVLSTWYFWIIINFVTIGLYYSRGLNIYAGLMVIYFIFSVIGYIKWNKTFKNSQIIKSK